MQLPRDDVSGSQASKQADASSEAENSSIVREKELREIDYSAAQETAPTTRGRGLVAAPT